MIHGDDFRFTAGQRLQDVPKIFIRHVGIERFKRLQDVPQVVLVKNDFRARDQEFESFAPHLFDENRNLHLASSAQREYPGGVCLDELQRNIRPTLPNQALLDMPGSQQLAFAPSQRRVVHEEVHLYRRGIDIDELEGRSLFEIGQLFANGNLFEAAKADDIPSTGVLDLDPVQSLMSE